MQVDRTRAETRRAIYDLLADQGMATKQDLSSQLGLSAPTVTKYVTYFLDAGLIEKKAKLASGEQGGRNPVAYACVPRARCAIGLDVTSERVRAVLVSLEGEVVARRRTSRPYERSDDYLDFLRSEIDALIDEAAVARESVLGVGVAVPALVNRRTGAILYSRVIDVLGMTAEALAARTDLPCLLIHDSQAAGLAEFWDRETERNAFYVGLGQTVGGSVLLGGEIYDGDGVFSGEVGHLLVDPGGAECYCGRRGCLDPCCSSDVLARVAGGSVEGFFELLDGGDPDARATWERYAGHLAVAIHDVRTLFGCRILLGGEVGPLLADRLPELCANVDALSFLDDPAADYLSSGRHGVESIATGAALHFVNVFRADPGAAHPAVR